MKAFPINMAIYELINEKKVILTGKTKVTQVFGSQLIFTRAVASDPGVA